MLPPACRDRNDGDGGGGNSRSSPCGVAAQALCSYRHGYGGVDTPALGRALRKLQDALESEAALSCCGGGDDGGDIDRASSSGAPGLPTQLERTLLQHSPAAKRADPARQQRRHVQEAGHPRAPEQRRRPGTAREAAALQRGARQRRDDLIRSMQRDLRQGLVDARGEGRCSADAAAAAEQLSAWRSAAQKAADLAEAAQRGQAAAEARAAEMEAAARRHAERLTDQAQATLRLGEQLKAARAELAARDAVEAQAAAEVLRPLLQQASDGAPAATSEATDTAGTAGTTAAAAAMQTTNAPQGTVAQPLTPAAVAAAAVALRQLLLQGALRDEDARAREQKLLSELRAAQQQVQQLQGLLQEADRKLAAADASGKEAWRLQASDAAAERLAAEAVSSSLLEAAREREEALQARLQESEAQASDAAARAGAAEAATAEARRRVDEVQREADARQQQADQEWGSRLRDQAASADARAQALQQRAAQLSLALDDATRGAAEAARVATADAARAAEAGEQARAAAVLDARLEGRRQLEEAKGRWQAERDALIERMAAERAGAELEARRAGDQQRRRLLDAVSELEAQRGHLAARLAAVLGSHSQGPEAAAAATAAAPERGGGPCLPPSGGGAALGHVSLDDAALRASAAAPSRATGVGGGGRGAEGGTGRDEGGEAGAALLRVQAEAYRRQAAALQAELEQLHRALREQKSATAAAEAAAREARAAATAAASALDDRAALCGRLQAEVLTQRHEMAAAAERAQWEAEAARAEARREVEAAMAAVQLITLKQQRLAGALRAAEAAGDGGEAGEGPGLSLPEDPQQHWFG